MHYFLIDFCYLMNALLIFHVHFYPGSSALFLVCFAHCTGPMAFAVVAWRNSCVFHSLDKITSGVIHLYPALVVYNLRWFPDAASAGALRPPPAIGPLRFLVLPYIVYLFWQVRYRLASARPAAVLPGAKLHE